MKRDEQNRQRNEPNVARRDRQWPDEESNQLRDYRADIQNVLDRSLGFIEGARQQAFVCCCLLLIAEGKKAKKS